MIVKATKKRALAQIVTRTMIDFLKFWCAYCGFMLDIHNNKFRIRYLVNNRIQSVEFDDFLDMKGFISKCI